MSVQEVGKAITTAVNRGICFACGGNLKKEEYSSNHICQSSGMYPWGCSECGDGFHLNEPYPTSKTEHCPYCASIHILEAHK